MGTSIRGIRIDSLSYSRKEDSAENEMTGGYALMSNTDKVLATQSINGYSDIKVSFSADTKKLLNQLIAAVKTDIECVLGLNEDEKGSTE